MSDDYAEAVMRLNDAVQSAVYAAGAAGMSDAEIASELRLIADQVEEGE